MYDRANFPHKTGTSPIVSEFSQLWDYVTRWQQTFRSYDRDNSGFIDKNELATALGMMGYRLQPATMDLFVKKFDRQHRGRLKVWPMLLHARRCSGELFDCG